VILAGEAVGDNDVMIRFNTSMESQPPAFTPTHSKVVEDVNLIPRHV
jgi:hypothetical protein